MPMYSLWSNMDVKFLNTNVIKVPDGANKMHILLDLCTLADNKFCCYAVALAHLFDRK